MKRRNNLKFSTKEYLIGKSYKAFYKKYLFCGVHLKEDGSFTVSGIDESVTVMPNTASAEDIGNAVIESFSKMEISAEPNIPDPYPPKEIELLCEKKLTVYPPRDSHFTDMEDSSAAEIYQLYKYAPSESAESTAAFYLGIASELNCDISDENIRKVWGETYGTAEIFVVSNSTYKSFDMRAEMRNKNVHRISFLKQIDEYELLECTMEVQQPNKRKKLDERLTAMFEAFANTITPKC